MNKLLDMNKKTKNENYNKSQIGRMNQRLIVALTLILLAVVGITAVILDRPTKVTTPLGSVKVGTSEKKPIEKPISQKEEVSNSTSGQGSPIITGNNNNFVQLNDKPISVVNKSGVK